VSTRLLLEGPDLAGLLTRVRDEHGPDARIVAAEKVRSGGIGGFFARERFEVQVEVDVAAPEQAVPSAVRTTRDPAEPAPLTGPVDLAELVDVVEAVEAAHQASQSQPAPATSAPGQPDRSATVSTETPDFVQMLAALQAVSGAPAPADQSPPRPTITPVAEQVSGPVPSSSSPWARVGLPESVCRLASRPSADHAGLVAALRTLPAVPRLPRAAGDVVVVLGDATAAYDVAVHLARRLRIDPATILLAAPTAAGTGVPAARRMASPEEARRRARALHRATRPTLVAVDAALDDEAADWARNVTDALAAAATWAVVGACVKPADLAAHLDRLGHLDAIAVRGARRTGDPGTVLGLGYPVALLDGEPASPRSWAALLADRLEAAERADQERRRGRW